MCLGDCKITALLFADGLVLTADSPSILQNLIVCSEWGAQWQWNEHDYNEIKMVHFGHSKRKFCQFMFTCDETPVQSTDCYKCLGVEFTEHLSWANSLDNAAISANKAACYLIAETKSSVAFMYAVYNHLCSIFFLPIIEYVWGLRSFEQISKIQNF